MKLHFKRAAYAWFSLLLLILFVGVLLLFSRTPIFSYRKLSSGNSWLGVDSHLDKLLHSSLFCVCLFQIFLFNQCSPVNGGFPPLSSRAVWGSEGGNSPLWLAVQRLKCDLGYVRTSQPPRLPALMGSQPRASPGAIPEVGIGVNFFPFNTVVLHINLNDSLRMIFCGPIK